MCIYTHIYICIYTPPPPFPGENVSGENAEVLQLKTTRQSPSAFVRAPEAAWPPRSPWLLPGAPGLRCRPRLPSPGPCGPGTPVPPPHRRPGSGSSGFPPKRTAALDLPQRRLINGDGSWPAIPVIPGSASPPLRTLSPVLCFDFPAKGSQQTSPERARPASPAARG